jgi:hypothetical protein
MPPVLKFEFLRLTVLKNGVKQLVIEHVFHGCLDGTLIA